MIDNISDRFNKGEITLDDVEMLLAAAFGDDEDKKDERRSRVIVDGQIVKFQLIGLNRQAKEAMSDQRVQEARAPRVDDDLLDDVPDFDGTENLGPDYVPEIKSRLGIIAGVRMFGKPQAKIRSNRTEGVKVRCPFNHHDDKRPSAWVNTDKNTWYCGKCQVGGDVIDFYAARKHGLQPSDFHRSPQFRAITEEMAEELGIEVYVPYDTSEWASPLPDEVDDEDDDDDATAELVTDEELSRLEPETRENDPPVPESAEATEPVTISEDEMLRGVALAAPGPVIVRTPTLSVDTLPIPEGTFLHSWLNEIRKGYPWVPEEYLLLLGLQAIGLAAGHYTVSRTANLPLTGSLILAIVGPSGYGKSTAANFLRDLVQTSGSGPKFDPGTGTGVKEIQAPASAEALLRGVKTEIEDPLNATTNIEVPTTGWMFEDELATFVSRSRRSGGGHLKQYLMKFHDFTKKTDSPEPVFDDLALTSGRRVVHDAFFSAVFLTQTQALRTLADNEDLVSGFMNRIIPVFGHQTQPQHPFKSYSIIPNPYYKERYAGLWKVCREGVTMGDPHLVLPEDACEGFFDQHPFFSNAQTLINDHPIYARLIHIALRLGLLFAINEHARDCQYNNTSIGDKQMEVHHLELAVQVMERLIQPGFTAIMDAVTASEVADYMDLFVEFIRDYYDKKQRHPMKNRVTTAAFNKRFDVGVRRQGIDFLVKSGQVVEMTLVRGRSKSLHYAVVEGKWRGLHNHTTYKEEELYGTK